MSKTIKIVRTIYLYITALVSLIFIAIGSGTLINTALKTYVFPKAEKGEYNYCNQQPPVYNLENIKDSNISTEQQRIQIDNLIRDYEIWKTDNSGENCLSAKRQNNIVNALTMIIVALPIFLFHWRIIRKEKDTKTNE
jgi:hypothetical protein